MLFHEYAITPHVFSEKYCGDDISIQKDLISFLKGLRKSGMIGNINKEQWQVEVKKYLADLPLSVRDKLSQLLQELSKHNRIVMHESIYRKDLSDNEIEWVEIMVDENQIEPYSAIISTGQVPKLEQYNITLDKLLDDPIWDNIKYSFVKNQTKSNLKKYLSIFLMYARKLIISDPYFTYNNKNNEDEESLMLYAELYAKRRGSRLNNRKIIIHTSYNTKDIFTDINSDAYKIKWISIFKKIHEIYGHMVTLYVWEDENKPKIVHDRYMITDQGGIHSGRGFTLNDNAESTFSLLENDDKRKCLNKFESNYSVRFTLKFSLNKDCDIPDSVDYIGTVNYLLHDNEKGKSGFILSHSGEKLYFQMPSTFHLCSLIKVGVIVEFEIFENQKGRTAKVMKIVSE